MPADPRRVKDLLAAATEIADPTARRAFLDRECGGEPDLRQRLDVLLRDTDHLGSALEGPLTASAEPEMQSFNPAGESSALREASGAVVAGRYKLLERVGEGGMGEVWVADQLDPVRRRVALKLIRPGMDSKQVLARFEAERQALALMDHPNIARVLDAGSTPDGRPYFVMELIKGVPITEFCDARKLTIGQRLGLFLSVCRAVQHAHQKGVIHRDLKPSNVLVALRDERPVPKVIDFGVAKSIGQQLTEKTLYTGFGALIGTPAYMAPEQATFNQLDIDTRADVHALGVLLYELLAGSTPFERARLQGVGLDELLRLVREEEPPRPSVRLNTSADRSSIAAARQTDPDRLARLVRGELDWIVMKALEKDRNRRYETAVAMAQDVERHLQGEVVEARAPTLGYRLQKLGRKYRWPLLAGGVVFGLLLGWGVTLRSGMREQERLNADYERSLRRALEQLEEAGRQRRAAEERAIPARMRAAEAEMRAVLDFTLWAQHFAGLKDAANCRATAEMWESRNRADAPSLYTAARLRATTAAVLKGQPGADAARLAGEEADRAMSWLKQAVAAGLDVSRVKADTMLDALRNREDFKLLVAGLEAGGPKNGPVGGKQP